jgi:hypothetical protein
MEHYIHNLNLKDDYNIKDSFNYQLSCCKDSLFKDLITFCLIKTFKEEYIREVSLSTVNTFLGDGINTDIEYVQYGFELFTGIGETKYISITCQIEFGANGEENKAKYRLHYINSESIIFNSSTITNHDECNKILANQIVNGHCLSKEEYYYSEDEYEHYKSQREYLITLAKKYI